MRPRGEQPLKLPLRKCKNFVDNLKQIFYSINAIIKSAKLYAGNSSAIRDGRGDLCLHKHQPVHS